MSDGNANPTWGGYTSLGMDSDHFVDKINYIRSAGGDVAISFGGANGVEIAVNNTDINTLTSKYQQVIDKYNPTWIDFDIEGFAVADKPSIGRRSIAIKRLQDSNPGLRIGFCLPVTPTGLDAYGLNVIDNATENGVEIDIVNLMVMDYGQGAAPDPAGKMGDYAISATKGTYDQLKGRNISATLGMTPMIGQNDQELEIFTIDNANQVKEWAESKDWVTMLGMWSINRDNNGSEGTAIYQWSQLDQENFEFTDIFKSFTTGFSSAQLMIPDTGIPANSTYVIPVKVSGITNAKKVSCSLRWNSSVITVNEVKANNSVFLGSSVTLNLTEGQADLVLANTNSMTDTEPEALFDISVIPGGNSGDSCTISIFNAIWTDTDLKEHYLESIEGNITIFGVKGDFNGNGAVDIGDVSRVSYMVAGLTTVNPAADFNKNGNVDTGDAARIAWYYIGKEKYL
ncbi:dockerin type I domain-containing protein [Methanoplanus limicola]|uniref:Uncharacterized protein n=1 Tax=Methanoplanus limicola DSM 2279 TaxID=937775 RepID=H1YYP0_9EURY|nr:dockerin type I domain-containing protein [Methanoplanus limicola]EHQ36023.1 hypothetical protein Metlim_1932 [Methanoplanus limicola DSM 2279]